MFAQLTSHLNDTIHEYLACKDDPQVNIFEKAGKIGMAINSDLKKRICDDPKMIMITKIITSAIAIVIIAFAVWWMARKRARDVLHTPHVNLELQDFPHSSHSSSTENPSYVANVTLTEGWEEQVDSDGSIHFIDHITGETVLAHPGTGSIRPIKPPPSNGHGGDEWFQAIQTGDVEKVTGFMNSKIFGIMDPLTPLTIRFTQPISTMVVCF